MKQFICWLFANPSQSFHENSVSKRLYTKRVDTGQTPIGQPWFSLVLEIHTTQKNAV